MKFNTSPLRRILPSLLVLCCFNLPTPAQHLIWRPKDDQGSYRCIYGEIEVLATAPTTYYCGCNWWPSCPAGGYTGIQDIDGRKHVMIFSVWDTTPELHSVAVAQGDPRTELSRFGGEGAGGKSMLNYHWGVGRTYRYFIVKRQDEVRNCTLASAFFYGDYLDRWVYEATIASPNNGDKAVKGFGGMMNAFLENFWGKDKTTPRAALYRLWVGTSPDDLTKVTEASGDGAWGVVNDSFFLSSGDDAGARSYINGHRSGNTDPQWGTNNRLNVEDRKLSPELLRSLKSLVSS